MRFGIPEGQRPRMVFRAAAWAAVVALAAATGQAQEKPAPQPATVERLGVQVSIDPATGRLKTPSPEEAQALAASLERLFKPARGLQAEQRSDGSLKLDLQGSALSVSLARRSADGSVATDCTNSLQHALEWLGAAPAPQTRPALETE